MSFVKELIDDLNRDLSGDQPLYGENVYGDGPWPGEAECSDDAERDE